MKSLTRTSIVVSTLSLLVAGQLLLSSARQTPVADFIVVDGTPAQLEGLSCVSKKLFFPKPPEKDEPKGTSPVQNGK